MSECSFILRKRKNKFLFKSSFHVCIKTIVALIFDYWWGNPLISCSLLLLTFVFRSRTTHYQTTVGAQLELYGWGWALLCSPTTIAVWRATGALLSGFHCWLPLGYNTICRFHCSFPLKLLPVILFSSTSSLSLTRHTWFFWIS